jgi:hypothetical protein
MLRRVLRVCGGLLLGLLGLGLFFKKPYLEQVWNEKYGLLWRIEPWGGDGPAFEARSRHVRHIRNMGKDGYDGLWKAGHEDWRGLCFALFLIC